MFYFGADYYPEHWPEERWPEDARLMETPIGVEVTERWQGEKRLLFVLNHHPEAQDITLKSACFDLLSGKNFTGQVTIAPREVLILTDFKKLSGNEK